MGANKFENFEIKVIDREEIHEADYNPRKITDSAFKKLKKWFSAEGKGQLAPLIVNKNTMTLVSGHQRLKVLDQLNRGKPYKLTVSMTDLDEKTEVEANIFMNNSSAMGEFDFEMLGDIHDMFPDISFTEDLGFDESELSIMFDSDEDIQAIMGTSAEAEEIKNATKSFVDNKENTDQQLKEELNLTQGPAKTAEEYRALRHATEANMKRDVDKNGSTEIERDDFCFTIVCANNTEKHELMRKLHEKENEKFVKASKLYDIYDHKLKLRELS